MRPVCPVCGWRTCQLESQSHPTRVKCCSLCWAFGLFLRWTTDLCVASSPNLAGLNHRDRTPSLPLTLSPSHASFQGLLFDLNQSLLKQSAATEKRGRKVRLHRQWLKSRKARGFAGYESATGTPLLLTRPGEQLSRHDTTRLDGAWCSLLALLQYPR